MSIRTQARASATLFVVFSIVATSVDAVWVRLGVIAYSGPLAWGQAWWTPLQYGAAAVALVLSLRGIAARERGTTAQDPGWAVVFSGSLFLTAQLLGGLADCSPIGAASAIGSLWLMRLIFDHPSPWRVARMFGVSAAVAAAGTVAEVAIGRIGLMHYRHGELAGVPIWLPFLWLHAGFLGRDIAGAWFLSPSRAPTHWDQQPRPS